MNAHYIRDYGTYHVAQKNGHPVTETVWPITQFLCMPKAFPTFDLWEFD